MGYFFFLKLPIISRSTCMVLSYAVQRVIFYMLHVARCTECRASQMKQRCILLRRQTLLLVKKQQVMLLSHNSLAHHHSQHKINTLLIVTLIIIELYYT